MFRGISHVVVLKKLSKFNLAQSDFEGYSVLQAFCCRIPEYPLLSQNVDH